MNQNIKLKSFKEIFGSNKQNMPAENQIHDLPVNKLIPFGNHPFKLYQGERFENMTESIRENGIIMPVIVRPAEGETYEILSGHNRVKAAEFIGLETVPAVIRENLTDDEAMLIVTETNLIQRSFSDLLHSEKAAALAVHHGAVKNQGRRTDLINEIEELLKNGGISSSNAESSTYSPVGKRSDGSENITDNASENTDYSTYSPVGKRLNNVVKIGEQYDLSKNSVARYLRINTLVPELKQLVDNEEISIRAAVELSYLTLDRQYSIIPMIEKLGVKIKIDMKKAGLMRRYSEEGILTDERIFRILSGGITDKKKIPNTVQPVKLTGKVLSKYFQPEQTAKEIQAELIEALEFYRSNKK